MNTRKLAALLTAMLLVWLYILPAQAEDGSVPAAMPMHRAMETMDGTVRVHLASLGSPASLDVTVSGGYSVDGVVDLNLYDGQKLGFTFDASTGEITMHVGSQSYPMGRELALRRHQATGSSGLYIAQAKRPKCIYEGDMQLIARPTDSGYKLCVIMHVFIETYLYGVVPNEMSSSWPLEALKAQAISARTYTVNRMNSQGSALYDLGDTASHQVYYGYAGTVSRAIQAVNETAGIVMMYGDTVASTFYTAYNGGQTESAKNIWGGGRYPYLAVKEDPYDAANPNSNRRTRTVYRDFDAAAQNASLQTLLRNAAGSPVETINGITLHTPKYPSPSRLYTKADFNLTLTSGSSKTVTLDIFGGLETAMDMSITSSNNEIWTVTDNGATFTLQAGRWGHGVGLSQRGAQQMANTGWSAAQILNFYFEGCTQLKQNFTASVLPPLGSGATVKPTAPPMAPGEQLAWVNSTASTLNLRSGPSKDYDIIAEIPRGTLIVVTSYGSSWCAVRWNSLTGYVMTSYLSFDVDVSTDGPAEENTPAPSVSDVPAGTLATVVADADLRAAASYSGEMLLMIPSGETVTILSYGENWAHVAYSNLTGYVLTETLQLGAVPTAPPAAQTPAASAPVTEPTAAPATPAPSYTPVAKQATVILESDLMSAPATAGERLATIPAGETVEVILQGDTWSQIRWNGLTGWTITAMLHIAESSAPSPSPTPTKAPETAPESDECFTDDTAMAEPREAWIIIEAGHTNLYAMPDQETVPLAAIPGGSNVSVLQEDETMCEVRWKGQQGYVLTAHIIWQEPYEAIGTRYVNTQTDPLTLRDMPTTKGSAALGYIPRGAQVRLIADLGDWAYIQYSGMTGYSAMRYLSRSKPEDTVKDDNIILDVTLEAVEGWTGKVTGEQGSSIDLRKWCSTDAPFVCEVLSGETVAVIKKGKTWCLINYEGREGYCLTTQLQLNGPAN